MTHHAHATGLASTGYARPPKTHYDLRRTLTKLLQIEAYKGALYNAMISQTLKWAGVLLALWLPLPAAAELSGNVALEARSFTQSPAFAEQGRQQFSLSGQAEWSRAWADGKQRIVFTPFARIDSADSARSHADIRELSYLRVGAAHEWRIGIRKVYWGVTESQHLVDIINQTDLVEDSDGEEKFGQPMVNLALLGRWGSIDALVLPGFRERSFPGVKGRLRSAIPVDRQRGSYDASNRGQHIDLAMRWSKSSGPVDSGLSYFRGTSRDPRFTLAFNGAGEPVLAPHYDLIEQWGLDLQAVQGAALWKAEAIRRIGQGKRYWASTTGLEYTLSDWLHSGKDLGLIAEYLYDDRGKAALSPFADDLMLGLRLSVNDMDSSEVLVGAIVDRDSRARVFTLESSRRVGEHWKWTLEGRIFAAIPSDDLLYGVSQDDFIKLECARYF